MNCDSNITAIAAALGGFVGAFSTYIFMRNYETTAIEKNYTNNFLENDLAVYGYPVSSFANKHVNDSLFIGFDRRFRTATWAYERLTANSVDGSIAHRRNKFFEDGSELALFRARNVDYKGSGFDKGHLAPAADFSCSQTAMDSSFTLSNICPQNPSLNRGFWGKTLEPFARGLTNMFDEVHIITGPLYLPKYDKERGEWRADHRVIGHTPSELKKTKIFVDGEETEMPLLHVPTHFL